ncbi:MAG TPA: hypothetical protein VFA38_00630 [Nitrospirales bacterium]|nr:hypothetical protein [Nitrospirales bacterium]
MAVRMLVAVAALSIAAPALTAAADVPAPVERRMITAVGVGRPPDRVSSDAQARLMTERAALLQALRNAARDAGRSIPADVQSALEHGMVRVGATIQDFRITRVTRRPDGAVEVEVTVPESGIHPR